MVTKVDIPIKYYSLPSFMHILGYFVNSGGQKGSKMTQNMRKRPKYLFFAHLGELKACRHPKWVLKMIH